LDPGRSLFGIGIGEKIQHEARLRSLAGQPNSERRPARRLAPGQHEGSVAIPNVPIGALRIVTPRGFGQRILAGDRAVLRLSPLGAPASTRYPQFQGNIQRSAVHAGLPSGYYFFDKWMHEVRSVDTMCPNMGKACWRIIQDETEAKDWTVTRAARPRPGGALHHIVTARKGRERCMVTSDSELAAILPVHSPPVRRYHAELNRMRWVS
jgi:hypothetical protein